MPEFFIITGSNGSGKSTIGNELRQTIKAPKEVRKLAFEYTLETFLH